MGSTPFGCRYPILEPSGLEPSVAQAPLPLQEFLPHSFLLPPPLPLQEFNPLQACFSMSFLAESSATFPATAGDAELEPP